MATLLTNLARRIFRFGGLIRDLLLGLPKSYMSPLVVRVFGKLVTNRYDISSKSPRKAGKQTVLLLRYHFYDADKSQLSPEIGTLDNTLRASGLADYEVLSYDSDLGISPYCDLKLISKCAELRPRIVILSSWWFNSNHPCLETLRFIRCNLGIPVVTIWWDTCNDLFWLRIAPYISEFDLHIIAENPKLYCLDKLHPLIDRFITVWAPLDQNLFYSSTDLRDIPVTFVGKATGYRANRKEYIKYLLEHGVEGYFSYADEAGQISHSEYANIIRRSQIGVNFSYSVDAHQLKGRVLEIMLSGALLFESENDQISMLFEPMVDYIPFTSKEDLLNKIKYFQDHPCEMATIASSGARKAKTLYSGRAFWETIFRRVDTL